MRAEHDKYLCVKSLAQSNVLLIIRNRIKIYWVSKSSSRKTLEQIESFLCTENQRHKFKKLSLSVTSVFFASFKKRNLIILPSLTWRNRLFKIILVNKSVSHQRELFAWTIVFKSNISITNNNFTKCIS